MIENEHVLRRQVTEENIESFVYMKTKKADQLLMSSVNKVHDLLQIKCFSQNNLLIRSSMMSFKIILSAIHKCPGLVTLQGS